jgi:hypothetical protein
MRQEYWCVVCEDCDTAIPLLEVDPKKQIRHPREFQAICLICKSQATYEGDELVVRKLERIPSFIASDGFLNVPNNQD